MSTIDKLSIRGIRSFGAEGEDEQKITFTSPLTLILGANGCGKTTIIECLKYALTGEMPPGCNKGQNFVHDPKIFNSSECLAQVKLQIQNLKGHKVVATRSMKTTVKGGSAMKFETLDSTVHVEIDGKAESISKRCIDINAEMANAMGVSKAIINHVLFCHQEDSNWPLDDGKKLKEKFDAIFGTTEYNKAIEKLIKIRKNYDSMAKLKEGDLKLLLHLKAETENKTVELQNIETKLSTIEIRFKSCEEEMAPIKERLIKIQTIEMEISKLYSQKVELTTKLDKCKDHQKSISNKIKSKFNGSIIMLDREIRTFKERMSEKKTNLCDFEADLNRIKIQEKKLQENLSDINRKRGTLIYQRQQEQDFMSERAKHVLNISDRLSISVNSQLENSNESIDDIMTEINSAFKREENILGDLSTSHDKIDHDMQNAIDKLREQRATIESDVISKRKQVEELKREENKNRLEIDAVEKSAQTLKKLEQDITKINNVYEEYSKSINLDDIKKSISEKRINRNKLQEQLDKIDEKITFLSSIAKTTAEIAIKENQHENRESELRKFKSKHSDNIRRLMNNKPIESNFKRNIQTIYQNMQREIGELNKSINKNQQLITELQINRKNQKDELNKMEKEIVEIEEKIYEQCHSTPFVEVLERVKENIAKHQLDHGALKSSEVLYKKYIQKMEDDPCCPLCHKDMSGNEVNDLTSELLDEIRRLPENIERTEKILKLENRKYETLLALQPITEKLEKLRTDIPKCKQLLKQTEEKLSTARNDAETYQISLAEPTSNLDLTNIMLGDMSLLDEALKDLAKIQQDLQTLKSRLPERTETITMSDAQLERSTLAAELKTECKDIELLQAKCDRELEMLNNLREKRNVMKDQRIKLQEGVQALSQLKIRQKDIETQTNTILAEIKSIEAKLNPLKNELRQAMDNKQKIKEENRQKLNAATAKLNELKRINNEIKRCTGELEKLAEFNLVEEIERLQVNMKKLMTDQKEKASENEKVSESIQQIRKEISGQEVIERDLLDNKDLKNLEAEQIELQKSLDDLTKDMGDLDFRSISREKDTLIKKQDVIIVKRSEFVGQMGELQSQIKALKGELSQPKYQESIKNYLQAFYEATTLKYFVSDLGEYRIALEWAMMKFHAEKMEKINRIIRELWRSIYRGNDIDYVQIKTDEMKTQNADKKRSFDYRVVQSKQDVELDMRGRCSAGQRVLACLIIRIALAETFSSNCGVLALDEPTTNLDRENIVSLCEALNKIVEDRQTQSNFMLLVITHDEEFITTLGSISNYYKVSRGTTGKSVIQKIKIY